MSEATRLDEATELLSRDRAAMMRAVPQLQALEQYGPRLGVLVSEDAGLAGELEALRGTVEQYKSTLADFHEVKTAHDAAVEGQRATAHATDQAKRRVWAQAQEPELFEVSENLQARLRRMDPVSAGALYLKTKWSWKQTQQQIAEVMAACPQEEL